MSAGDMAVYTGLVLVGAGSFVAARRYWKELTQDGRSTFELPFGIRITLADSALAIAALGIVLVIVGANFPSRDKTSASDAGQKDLSTKDNAVGLDCSKNRNADLTVNIFSKPARSPDKLKAALERACFKVHSGPFPYTAHVDPDQPGTTYIIPSKQLAAKGAIKDSVEETIVDLALSSVDATNVIPPGGKGPGIFAGGPGPVSQDVMIYLF